MRWQKRAGGRCSNTSRCRALPNTSRSAWENEPRRRASRWLLRARPGRTKIYCLGRSRGTIDGVDNPAAAAGTGLARSLLSEDAVVGEFAFDGFADETLVFFVGNGHRRCIRFRLDANAARANVRRVLSSHGGDTSGKFEFSLVVHRLP